MAKKTKIYSGRNGAVGRDGENDYVQRPVGGLAYGEKTTVRSGAKSSRTFITGERQKSLNPGLMTPSLKVKSPAGLSKYLRKPKGK